MRPPRRSREAGFSYIEVLVGIIILAIVAGGIAQGLSQTSASIGRSKIDTTANKLAAAQLDRAHRMSYEDVGIVDGSPPGTIPATVDTVVGKVTYRTAVDVQYVDDPALGQPQTYVNYKKVIVAVTPQVEGGRTATVSTLVAPPSIGAIAGKSTIIVSVVDALTGEPVAGAPVTADQSTSPTQTRTTGADGKVVFAGLEPSAIPVTDPKYKYRLTIGLPAPWVTSPDSAPDVAQQHLAASQSWTTTLKVFRASTISVNLRDAATGQPVTERSEVSVSTPSPNVITETQIGTTGSFSFTDIGGEPIQPSYSEFTVLAQADCYVNATIKRPVPTGYPGNTTEAFNFSMTRAPSGYLDVVVRSNNAQQGYPVLADTDVSVSGGQSSIPARVRTTDASGRARFCLPPSGSASYVVSASRAGYGDGSILASVAVNQTTPLTIYLAPSPTTGTIRLAAGSSNRLVRLQAVSSTYDASKYTNSQSVRVNRVTYTGLADFTNLAAGNYIAYIATGFSGGTPSWSAGRTVSATGGTVRYYKVP